MEGKTRRQNDKKRRKKGEKPAAEARDQLSNAVSDLGTLTNGPQTPDKVTGLGVHVTIDDVQLHVSKTGVPKQAMT